MQPTDFYFEQIKYLLFELESTSASLRKRSYSIFLVLLSDILFFSMSLIYRNSIYFSDHFDYRILRTYFSLGSLIIAASSLFLLYLFNSNQKYGATIYEELVESLESLKMQSNKTNRESSHDYDYELSNFINSPKARIIMRNFIRQSSLPLVDGKHGVTVYFLLFISMLIGHLVFLG